MANAKINWRKIVDEYIEFNGSSTKFCENRNISKGQLFYYKKKFISEDTVFCPINLKEDKTETISTNGCSNSQNVVAIEFKNAKISMPASETALIKSIVKELASLC